ncbi:MAG: MCE family protein [Deltaproteobacteria bacterium]|nr:MCE family protein [Deltaproteobacteria bacterium]
MKKLFTPIKVGLLSIVAIGGLLFAMRTVQEGALGAGDAYRVYAVLDNVLGVATRSRVTMAGIEVGFIESIELEGSRARINLRIRREVPLYRDASLAKISESLLGDKLIELDPGKDSAHQIPDGGQIVNVYEEKDITEIFRQLDGITADIKSVTEKLRNMIGEMDRDDALGGIMRRMSEIAENVAKLTRDVNTTFETGSVKVQQILSDVAGVTAGTRERYAEILDNVRDVSRDVRKLVNNLNDIVGQGGEDWSASVGGVKEALEKANRTLANLDRITKKIDEGQGTVGRLVNDDKVLQKTEEVLDDVSTVTSSIGSLQTIVDLRSEYHVNRGDVKSYVGLTLQPKSDKAYIIEVIDDPRGSVELTSVCTNPTGEDPDCKETATVKDEFKFSLQLYKRFYWAALRFGVIENTGGVGANFYFFNDDLQFRMDLFQFGKDEFGRDAYPRLKAMAIYRPSWLSDHIYFAAGGDDFFNYENDSFDYFFGAGVHFNDTDLKGLFTAVGTPSL